MQGRIGICHDLELSVEVCDAVYISLFILISDYDRDGRLSLVIDYASAYFYFLGLSPCRNNGV